MATSDDTGADAPTKPISELTDSELDQEFLELLEAMSPEELKEAKDPVARKEELVASYRETFANPYKAAELGYIDALGVIEIDKHNVEHKLEPGAVIRLKPGMRFGKKHRWKRG